MKKKFLTLAVLGLGLAGCGGNTSASTTAPTSTSAETSLSAAATSPSATASRESSPASSAPVSPSAEPTRVATTVAPEPAETPVQAIQPPADNTLTRFAGTTLKGNDVYFVIFPSAEQQAIRNFAVAVDLNGSWGNLCSNMATHEQLQETAIELYPAGEMKTWYSYNYAFTYSSKTDEQLAATKTKILEVSNQYSAGYASCKPFYIGNPSAAYATYSSASVGRFNIDLPTSDLAPLNKL